MFASFKTLAVAGVVLAAGAMANPAFADGNVSIGISVNSGGMVRSAFVPPPVYHTRTWVAPPVNYYQPTAIYYNYQPGGYYNPPSYSVPVYSPPVYYAPPVSYGPVYTPRAYYAPPVVYRSTTYYYQPGGIVYGQVPAYYNPQPRLTFGLIGRW